MKTILVTILFFFSLEGSSAELFGVVTDQSGEPLPFATLYIQHTTRGTTTNAEGKYSLPLEPGKYEIIFQYVGYKKQQIPLVVDHRDILLNVVLEPEALELDEVVIVAGGPDPAYAVIKKAIEKRKHHLEEVQAYKCNIYIKGIQTLDEKPDQVLGMNIALDTGIVYLSESISELSFEQPDRIKEVMISSKVSGSSTAFSFNQGSQMLISFYDNLMTFTGLSERGFVSPIANNALMFYEYKLVGTMVENDLLVNKIEVIPKRKNDPVFSGYIYIIEDKWRIHSIDLSLTKDHQIEFIDELNIHQVYAPVQGEIWMVLSQRFSYYLNVFGFRGQGNFVGIHSNYEIEPKDSQDSTALFSEKYFSNEILKIDEEANKRNTEYWEGIRPIPLTSLEQVDYAVKDSIQDIVESKSYKDSIDRVVNKFNIQNLVIGGYLWQASYKERYYRFQPIYNLLQYNTVEGAVVNVKTIFTQENERVWKYQITPTIRYGFASESFYYKAKFSYQFDPIKRTRMYVEGGKFISQFNWEDPISPLINTFETLVNRSNYMKIYEKTYGKFHFSSEIVNGITWKTTLEYGKRKELFNQSDYSFFYENDRAFTPNLPVNGELPDVSFGENNALIFVTNFYIKFKQKYISRPDMKFNMDSDYPTLFVYYRKGIPVLGSDVDFDEVLLRIFHNVTYGLFGTGNYTLWLGTFLNNDQMMFADYRHHAGNQSIFANFDNNNFQLLDYYAFSTAKSWIGMHVDHHFNGFIMNKFPLLRKTKAQVVGSLNYLNTSSSGHYLEYGIGIEHIFKIARIDYYGAIQNGNNYGHGIRIGMGF